MKNKTLKDKTIEDVMHHFWEESSDYGGWPLVVRKTEVCLNTLKKFNRAINVKEEDQSHFRLESHKKPVFPEKFKVQHLLIERDMWREAYYDVFSNIQRALAES